MTRSTLRPGSGQAGSGQACWAEQSVARRTAAIEHLKACGFFVQRHHRDDPVPTWRVSQFDGWHTAAELIELAVEYGFDIEGFERGLGGAAVAA
jgi:hypothetical protein